MEQDRPCSLVDKKRKEFWEICNQIRSLQKLKEEFKPQLSSDEKNFCYKVHMHPGILLGRLRIEAFKEIDRLLLDLKIKKQTYRGYFY